MQVWHDGAGFGAGWHLDYIEVRAPASHAGKVTYFYCGRWLDKKEDDGLIRRRLKVRAAGRAGQSVAAATQAIIRPSAVLAKVTDRPRSSHLCGRLDRCPAAR